MSVLTTRPSGLGVNIPATTTMPACAAMARTRLAHGPSSGSAIGPSGTPNRHIVPSGNTTKLAPSAAAPIAWSPTWSRFAAGSVPLWICANAIRMPASLDGCNRLPRHGEHRVAYPAPLRLDVEALVAQPAQHRPPACPRPEYAVTGDGGPGVVGGGQQRVDRLAFDVVMDQHLGQPFGQVRRALDGERVAGQGEAERAVAVEQHPAAATAQR